MHDAQLAIAREHGLSSWTALKEHITSLPDPEGRARADQVGGLPVQRRGPAYEALRPHAGPDTHPVRAGFGWMINESIGLAGHGGNGPAGSASLVMKLDSNQVHVAMTSRRIPIEPVNGQVIRAMAEAEDSDDSA
jgi:hypothetical protein